MVDIAVGAFNKLSWTVIGDQYLRSKQPVAECGRVIDRDVVSAAIKMCMTEDRWRLFIPGESVAMSPGMAINSIVRTIRAKKPLRYVISNALAPYGFYGVEFEYSNARVKSYWIDTGCEVICLVADEKYK